MIMNGMRHDGMGHDGMRMARGWHESVRRELDIRQEVEEVTYE